MNDAKYWFIMPMPLNSAGQGPEMDVDKVCSTQWEIWTECNEVVGSYSTAELAKEALKKMRKTPTLDDFNIGDTVEIFASPRAAQFGTVAGKRKTIIGWLVRVRYKDTRAPDGLFAPHRLRIVRRGETKA